MSECVFCRNIVTGKDAHIFYRDEYVIGFMDRFPVEKGHALIIPAKHYVNIFDIDLDHYLRVHQIAKYVSQALMEVFEADGINVGQNNGECARQVVMHYHLHVIPRHCGRDVTWERIMVSDSELKKQAELIRDKIQTYMDKL
ncbi:MAG: HIT family protein [Candidatus Thermoplasmatota archaeon]|jgi:diadenosine tetraphosphate (Ap4A) HIT family hydrolase|nr:HIT family protein [Candidatus Thermoplasmatota archaeon]MCL5988397.1 HIT family protein [Candidatus Thermoplasmatota archaeon]